MSQNESEGGERQRERKGERDLQGRESDSPKGSYRLHLCFQECGLCRNKNRMKKQDFWMLILLV